MTPGAEKLRAHLLAIYSEPRLEPVPLMAPVALAVTVPLFVLAELTRQARELETTVAELAGVRLCCEVLRDSPPDNADSANIADYAKINIDTRNAFDKNPQT